MTTAPTPTASFSEQLREGTRREHLSAERSPLMRALMRGQLLRDQYAQLLGQLRFIYDTLEAEADRLAGDPVVAAFHDQRLRRGPSLRRDVEALLGPDGAAALEPLPATQRYCDRIRAVSAASTGGFIAHHYTRYLGDLSGGQMLGRIVRSTLSLDETNGASFHRFPDDLDPTSFKQRYRHALDTTPWDPVERERIVEEARTAFGLNEAVFAELATRVQRPG